MFLFAFYKIEEEGETHRCLSGDLVSESAQQLGGISATECPIRGKLCYRISIQFSIQFRIELEGTWEVF